MKQKILILLLFVLGARVGIYAQDYVFTGSFEACKEKAQQEGKIILIDLYFEGCMPCKQMDEQVFPNAEVARRLASDFILYKTDVFKEEDGMKLARKYAASGFPTYVAVDAAGKVLDIEAGFMAVNRFIPFLQQLKNKREEQQFLAFDTYLEYVYPASYNYRYMRKGEKGDFGELPFFLKGKSLYDEVPFVVSTLVNTQEVNEWVYAHLPELIERYSGTLLLNKVNKLVEQRLQAFGKQQHLDSIAVTLNRVRPVYNDRLWSVYLPIHINNYYKGSKDALVYLDLMDKYSLFSSWDERSNALAEVIIDQKDNKKALTRLSALFLEAKKSKPFAPVDNYKFAIIYAYLGDWNGAKKEMSLLLQQDISTSRLTLKDTDITALKEAVEQKNISHFQPVVAKKALAITMN